MATTLKLGFSYAVFGALMCVSTGILVLIFSDIDFSTGELSVTSDMAIAMAHTLAIAGGAVGGIAGVVISLLPGESKRGRRLGVVKAVAIPIGTFFGSIMFAAVISLILAILEAAGIDWLQYQRQIIVAGLWLIPAVVVLLTVLSKEKPPRSSGRLKGAGYAGGYYGGGYYAGGYAMTGSSHGNTSGTAPASGFGMSTTYRTTKDFFGDGTTTRGSDGTTYHTTKDFFGDGTTTRGSDGTTYHTTKDFFGDGTTTRGSDGTTYHTTKDLFGGGYTTRGSDGSVYHTRNNFFGDGTTTRRD